MYVSAQPKTKPKFPFWFIVHQILNSSLWHIIVTLTRWLLCQAEKLITTMFTLAKIRNFIKWRIILYFLLVPKVHKIVIFFSAWLRTQNYGEWVNFIEKTDLRYHCTSPALFYLSLSDLIFSIICLPLQAMRFFSMDWPLGRKNWTCEWFPLCNSANSGFQND